MNLFISAAVGAILIILSGLVGMYLDIKKITTSPPAFWFIGALTGVIALAIVVLVNM